MQNCAFLCAAGFTCGIVKLRHKQTSHEVQDTLENEQSHQEQLVAAFRETAPTQWEYIAEGALNVALAYAGPDPTLMGYVLRVRKDNPVATGGVRCPPNPWITYNRFVETIITPLFGRRYVQPSIEVPLGSNFMQLLGMHIEESRPLSRRKYPLDANLRVGLLMLDNTCIPTVLEDRSPSVCFEIKPKCGFLPQSKWVTYPVKRKYSRFTMQQFYKLQRGERESISKYSPLDLFACDQTRIRNALGELVKTPQNNFRLFVNGKMRYPDEKGHGSPEQFQSEIGRLSELGIDSEEILDLLASILFREPLLDRIRRAQQLDDLDIEAIWPIYQQVVSDHKIPSLLDRKCPILPREQPTKLPSTIQDKIEAVQRYMLAATAKDCSIMIVVRPSDCKKHPETVRQLDVELLGDRTVVHGFNGFDYSIAIVDLDAKPIEKMEHYFKLDKKIAEMYTEHLSTTASS